MKKRRSPDEWVKREAANAGMSDDPRKKHWDAWRDHNQAAINSMNRYVAKHGLLSDKYRQR